MSSSSIPRTTTNSGSIDGSLRALGIALDEGILARLDELFAGVGLTRGRSAPEAYAW
ncbi:hypothetical protein [Actinomadura chokoriensis]|uniref:hypothetical protein n=1 Tax=Actinomadura chokoriensis TaxID=454156 RepID=UPI0031FA432F